MNASAKLCQIQCQRIQKQSEEMGSFELFNLLTAPELFDVLEAHLPEHRERQYPPTETLSMFLSQAMSADRSCQNAVNNREVRRTFGGMPRGNTYTGSYCKARRRLPTALVKELARHTGKVAGETRPINWLWKGRPVKNKNKIKRAWFLLAIFLFFLFLFLNFVDYSSGSQKYVAAINLSFYFWPLFYFLFPLYMSLVLMLAFLNTEIK